MEFLFDHTFYGELASKSNSRRLVKSKKTKRIISIKSKKALSFKASFEEQIVGHCPDKLIDGDIVIYVDVWYASRRPDLDIELMKDLLQGYVYHNDRQIKEQHSMWHLSKDNPRCRVVIVKATNTTTCIP